MLVVRSTKNLQSTTSEAFSIKRICRYGVDVSNVEFFYKIKSIFLAYLHIEEFSIDIAVNK